MPMIDPFPSYQQRIAELRAQSAKPWEFSRMALLVAGSNLKAAAEHPTISAEEKTQLADISTNVLFIRNELPRNTVSLLEAYAEQLADSDGQLNARKKRDLDELQTKIVRGHQEAALVLMETEKQRLLQLANSQNTATRQAAGEAAGQLEDAMTWLNANSQQKHANRRTV
ncbi:MAG: hypothetical protein KGJ06_09075 [Pseudomonadota bacterium]|nr:hypothetical protein [Pseudomonadota bacterium]